MFRIKVPRAIVLSLSIALGLPQFTSAQVVINELDLTGHWVELKNIGAESEDLSNWWLCTSPEYGQIGTLHVISGSTNLEPDSFLVIAWPDAKRAHGELGLYKGSDFANPNQIVDYVQYGEAGQPTESVAVLGCGRSPHQSSSTGLMAWKYRFT